MKKFSVLIILFIIALSVKSQSEIPNVVLHDIDGKEVNSETLNNDGKPFAICFWAVWNKTSLLELNNLMESRKVWHNELGVKLYAISIDETARIPRAKAYLEVHEWKCNVLFDESGIMEKKMKISGVPHIILFDGSGKVVWQEHEYENGLEEDFIAEIKKL